MVELIYTKGSFMSLTYSESFPAIITRAEAIREIKDHSVPASEFFAEYGDHLTYKADDLLGWLGY